MWLEFTVLRKLIENFDLHLKFGFDHYSEIIKHQDTKYYAYTDNAQSDIDNAWNSFYTTAENIIDDRWTSHQNDCAFLKDNITTRNLRGENVALCLFN